MRYLITFKYDGSKFHGFQRLNNNMSVQGTLEKSISKILNDSIVIKGSGRTDAGVHAVAQCAHFDYEKQLPKSFKKEINKLFGDDLKITRIKQVSDEFHARYSVKKKCYKYVIKMDKHSSESNYYFVSRAILDIKRMKIVSKILEGTHDYRNFVSGKRDDYVSTIYKINIKKRKEFLIIEFVGVGFYRYMVRHLVGALYDVGRGKVDELVVKNMLDEPSIEKNLTVVPASGLYLMWIKY